MKLDDDTIAAIETDLRHVEAALRADTSEVWKLTAAAELERIAKFIRDEVKAAELRTA